MRAVLLGVLLSAATAWAEPNLNSGDRVLFYGDIAARSTAVAERVESFFALRYPQRGVSFRHFEIRRTSSVKDATPDFADLLTWNQPKIVVLSLGPAVISEEKLPDEAILAVFEKDVKALLETAKLADVKVVMVTPVAPFLPSYIEQTTLSSAASAAKKRADLAKKLGKDVEVAAAFPYGAATAEEAGRRLDEAIEKMAASLRRVAEQSAVGLLDAHAEMARVAREHGDRIRAYPVEGRTPLEIASRREVLVNALAVNVTAGMLLAHFGAEPIDVQIRFDWQDGSAESNVGSVELVRVSETARRLILKSLPLPWDLGERGPAWWELNPASKYCGIILRVRGAPAGGVQLSDGTMNRLAVSAADLEKGFNLACGGPLPTSQAAAQLNAAMSRKNQAAGRVALYRKERVEEPEFEQPYQAMLRATQMWMEAYEQVLARTPRTLDTALEVSAK
jgi:hypothetical protein